MNDKIKSILEPFKLHKKIGDFLELFEDLIVFLLTLLLFYLNLIAIYDLFIDLVSGSTKFTELVPKFLYIFILTELFRLMIVYLSERRIDTSLIVKTTLIAILREIIIKAPTFHLPEYVGVSILLSVLGLMYYLPKFWFSKDVLRKDIAVRRRLRKLKEKG